MIDMLSFQEATTVIVHRTRVSQTEIFPGFFIPSVATESRPIDLSKQYEREAEVLSKPVVQDALKIINDPQSGVRSPNHSHDSSIALGAAALLMGVQPVSGFAITHG